MKVNRCIDTGRVRRNFSSRAGEYDRHAVVQKEVAERLLELLFTAGPAEGRCLEVGTGTGRLAAQLSATCPSLQLMISDIAHGMTRHAAARLPRALAVDADAQSLPLVSGCLNLVLSSSVYQWINDLPLAFSEAARVLAPGGRFAFALFGKRTLRELRESHLRATIAVGGKHPSHTQDFHGEEAVRRGLVLAGFVSQQVFSEETREYHAAVADLLRKINRIGAGNAAAARPAGLASRRVMQRMIALYEEKYRCTQGIPATWHVIYGLAEKAGR